MFYLVNEGRPFLATALLSALRFLSYQQVLYLTTIVIARSCRRRGNPMRLLRYARNDEIERGLTPQAALENSNRVGECQEVLSRPVQS